MTLCAPETVAMVELAVDQKPLHQVDVLLAGGAGAAEGAAVDGRKRRRTTCLRRLDRLSLNHSVF